VRLFLGERQTENCQHSPPKIIASHTLGFSAKFCEKDIRFLCHRYGFRIIFAN
jgi:hypothetical protein